MLLTIERDRAQCQALAPHPDDLPVSRMPLPEEPALMGPLCLPRKSHHPTALTTWVWHGLAPQLRASPDLGRASPSNAALSDTCLIFSFQTWPLLDMWLCPYCFPGRQALSCLHPIVKCSFGTKSCWFWRPVAQGAGCRPSLGSGHDAGPLVPSVERALSSPRSPEVHPKANLLSMEVRENQNSITGPVL